MVTLTTGLLFLLLTFLHLLCVGNPTKVVRACADRHWNGPRLSKARETLT
jgi:hypothetical protein